MFIADFNAFYSFLALSGLPECDADNFICEALKNSQFHEKTAMSSLSRKLTGRRKIAAAVKLEEVPFKMITRMGSSTRRVLQLSSLFVH